MNIISIILLVVLTVLVVLNFLNLVPQKWINAVVLILLMFILFGDKINV